MSREKKERRRTQNANQRIATPPCCFTCCFTSITDNTYFGFSFYAPNNGQQQLQVPQLEKKLRDVIGKSKRKEYSSSTLQQGHAISKKKLSVHNSFLLSFPFVRFWKSHCHVRVLKIFSTERNSHGRATIFFLFLYLSFLAAK